MNKNIKEKVQEFIPEKFKHVTKRDIQFAAIGGLIGGTVGALVLMKLEDLKPVLDISVFEDAAMEKGMRIGFENGCAFMKELGKFEED